MSQFSLEHFCEPMMEDSSYFSKKMFGGLAIYYNDLMTFVLVETPGDREWRGQKYDFDLWNGVLICTSREHHEGLRSQFPSLTNHPVLGKWQYLPISVPSFEQDFEGLVQNAVDRDPKIGIVPGLKKRSSKKKSVSKKKKSKKKVARKIIKKSKKKVTKKKAANKVSKRKSVKKSK